MIRQFLGNVKGVLAFAACTVNTIINFIPLMALAFLKFAIPIAGFRRLLSRWIMAIGEFWIDVNSWIFAAVNNTRWDVQGIDALKRDSWYLIMSNHLTAVDIVAVQTILNRKIPFLKFFIKQELIWFPFLGIAWWAMDMPFMKRYSKSYLAKNPGKKGMDLEITKKACQKFRDTPTTVINFIEGTRFTEEKKLKRNSPFDNLMPPRAGGIALALSAMGEMFDAILDVTIIYPDGPPRLWAMFRGEIKHVIIKIEQRPIEGWMTSGDYSNDREYRRRFHQWLTSVWQEKDRQINRTKSEMTVDE